MYSDAASASRSKPWHPLLTQSGPEPWASGRGILVLSGVMIAWFASLITRFVSGAEAQAAFLWLGGLTVWLVIQAHISRNHLPERYAFAFSTILQAIVPTLATLGLFVWVPALNGAALQAVAGVGVTELVAIHILRLAAWGTIAKYQKGHLPRYFYLFGSIPDLGFAVFAMLVTGWIVFLGGTLSGGFLLAYSFVGAAVFLGAATTMYFGVPGSGLSWRWNRVLRGDEAPTLLPFRWPMNLAPAFCGGAFWLAHALLVAKVMAGQV